MRAVSSILVALAATAAVAYQVDPNLPDGVYVVPTSRKRSGETTYGPPIQVGGVVQPGSDAYNTTITARSLNKRLPISDSKCWGDNKLSPSDYAGARLDFTYSCDLGTVIPGGDWGIKFAKHGSALVWGCSNGGDNPCSSSEWAEFDKYMADTCGATTAGYAYMLDWAKMYGRDDLTGTVCGNSV